jgi:hypothetical protein
MKETLEQRLTAMCGKKYMYNAVVHNVLSFNIENNIVTIVTDRQWIKVPITAVNRKLDEFEKIEEPKTSLLPVQLQNKETLIDILNQNISKIQNNPEYIGQAKEINNQIKTIIDIFKTELLFHRVKK